VLKPLKTLEKLVTKQAKQRMAIEHMQQHVRSRRDRRFVFVCFF
jgi:hypothetical protein